MSRILKAGLLGHPVAHSLSPLIHAHWIKKYNIRAEYRAFDVAPGDLEGAVAGFAQQGFAGLNVTLPYKTEALKLCDSLEDGAAEAGAANTLVFNDGKIHGLNTDMFGFTENIKSNLPDFDFGSGPCVVLGSGGAARAIVAAFNQEDCPEIRIATRDSEKAADIKKCSKKPEKIKIIPWDNSKEAFPDAILLVNATPLGMEGQPMLHVSLDSLPRKAAVADIVYAPRKTPLLLAAQAQGHPVAGGIGMLLQQARPAFKAWFNIMPDIDKDLEALVEP